MRPSCIYRTITITLLILWRYLWISKPFPLPRSWVIIFLFNNDHHSPLVMSATSGAMLYRICISNSLNLSLDQYRSSFIVSPPRWKNRTNIYSPKIGPMAPEGGQGRFSINRGIIGLPRVTDRFTCKESIWLDWQSAFDEITTESHTYLFIYLFIYLFQMQKILKWSIFFICPQTWPAMCASGSRDRYQDLNVNNITAIPSPTY